MKVIVHLKNGLPFETTEGALDDVKRVHGDNISKIVRPDGSAEEVADTSIAPPADQPPADQPPADDAPPATDNEADPKKLFGKKIKGVGEATIRDILAIYPTQAELLEALSNGKEVPVRDDVAKNIAEAFA